MDVPAASPRLRLTHAQMYARLLAGDPSYNGRFFTGVLTTGIYCLPSCGARKPRPENVRFYPSCEAARAAGLRACRKCHPDDFARGADPVLGDIETLVGELRAEPARFPNVRSVVDRSGFGATRLFELLRQHYHATPHDLLLQARLETVRRGLLETDDSPMQLALEAGFETLSVFHEHFRWNTGMTPLAYRELRDAARFRIALPPDYAVGYLRRALGRDPQSRSERLEGDRFEAVVHLPTGPQLLTWRIDAEFIDVAVESSAHAVAAHTVVTRWLGLSQPAAAFARHARKLGLARLVAHRTGLRICQTPTVFDGLIWSIIGQQINLPFACTLRRRLTERVGQLYGNGLIAPPTPEAVARLESGDLLALQFSRQKADYLINVARLIGEGALDPEGLRTLSATRVERTLLGLRGFGAWAVNYVMMRALGLADCVPLGDTGVTSGLQALLQLEARPDVDATRRLMLVFAPYRSLATAHLWQFNQPIP